MGQHLIIADEWISKCARRGQAAQRDDNGRPGLEARRRVVDIKAGSSALGFAGAGEGVGPSVGG